MRLRVASLFSGIGGLDLGLERAGHDVVLRVERDAHCRELLRRRYPDGALMDDVAAVMPRDLDGVDLLAAGFPCNDCSFENAARPGLEHGRDTRLVRHVFRLLRERRVEWVLLENVVGLLRWHRRRRRNERQGENTSRSRDARARPPAIDHIVTEFEKLGYRWAYRVVDLLAFGVPHKRRRVFIVASAHGDPRDVLLSQDSQCQGRCETFAAHARVHRRRCYDCFNAPPRDDATVEAVSIDVGENRRPPLRDICQCLTTSNGRRTCVVTRAANDARETPTTRALAVEDAERLMGFEPGYAASCYPIADANGRAPTSFNVDAQTSKRFALLGLACAVPQSAWVGERLQNPYAVKFPYAALCAPFRRACPGGDDDDQEGAWPLAAYNVFELDDANEPRWKSRRRAPKTLSESPVVRAFVPLGEFLKFQRRARDVDRETLRTYARRLRASGHDDVDELVRLALLGDERRDGKRRRIAAPHVGTTVRRAESVWSSSDDERDDSRDDDAMPTFGARAWVRWRGKRGDVATRWPCLVLDAGEDGVRGVTTHRHVVFFDAARSHARVRSTDIVGRFGGDDDDGDNISERADIVAAIERARAWKRDDRNHEYDPVAWSFREPTACLECATCREDAPPAVSTPDRSRGDNDGVLSRSLRSSFAPDSKTSSSSKCPQATEIIPRARLGHVGATLALRRGDAVGRRLRVFWPIENAFFAGTIAAFDKQTYTFRVDYDDGDVEVAFKPWMESVWLEPR